MNKNFSDIQSKIEEKINLYFERFYLLTCMRFIGCIK